MAQLNATVEQIQLTTNMLKSGDSKDWTDVNYPSAKAVSDLVDTKIAAIIPADKFEHPIGSVLITSTNVNPGASVGGTWELFDKEYKNDMTPYSSGATVWAAGGANLTAGYCSRDNHTVRLRLVLTTTSSVTADTLLGTISPTALGASTDVPRLAFGIADLMVDSTQAANGNKSYDIQYHIDASGAVTIKKVFNDTTLPVGTVIDITAYIPMEMFFMADWACNKFYWKRTK